MKVLKTEVCIIGAGPAGSTTSLFLNKYGIKSILIEKESFPKNKVCGEGTRGQVENVLNKLDPKLVAKFNQITRQLDNLKVTSGSGLSLTVSFTKQKSPLIKTLRRYEFDNFLIDEVKRKENITFVENKFISEYKRIANDEVILTDKDNSLQVHTKLVIMATGTEGIYKNNKFFSASPKPIQLFGLRTHYSNVFLPEEKNMELFLPKKSYGAWLFITYLPGNYVNVLSVIRKEKITKEKVNFRNLFKDLYKSLVEKRPEFENAIQESNIDGTYVNLYGKNKKFSGDNYLLVGDAASSSNPILGFGIGHAMYSGMIAANQIQLSLQNQNYSASYLKNYDKIWWKKLGMEHNMGKIVYHLLEYPKLIEFIMKSKFLVDALSNPTIEKNFFNPLFYIKKLLIKS